MEKKQISEKELIQIAQNEESIIESKKKYYSKTQSILLDTIKTIETLKEVEKNPEKIYFTIGLGVMVEAKITNTKIVKRSFSEKGYFNEDIKETKKWLEKRRKNLEEQLKKISNDISKSENQLNNIISVLRKLQEDKEKLFSKNIATK